MFSALPLRADIAQQSRHVRFVPTTEVAASIDHFVGVREQRRRDINAEGLRGLQIDDQLEPGRQLDGEIGRFRTFQDLLPYRITTTANLAPTTFRFDAALDASTRAPSWLRTRAPTHSTCSQPAARSAQALASFQYADEIGWHLSIYASCFRFASSIAATGQFPRLTSLQQFARRN